MGIQGLLPLIDQAKRQIHLSDLDGLTIAVDAYVWLHKAVRMCCMDLMLGKKTTKYVNYFLDQTALLCRHGITPYFVFDGGPLPSKLCIEQERAARRNQLRAEGLAHYAANRREKAFDCFAGAVDVTPQMAHEVIKELRRHGIKHVVAPFEADAQLCYLEREGIVDAVLTEDSDLVVFGCKRVLCKLNREGKVDEFLASRLSEVKNGEVILGGRFTHDKFRWMCILAGCDYLRGIQGIGLKKAYKVVRFASSWEAALRSGYQFRLPPGYADEFRRAERTFLYQRVYDPRSQQLVTLNEIPTSLAGEDMPYIGEFLPPHVAQAVAECRICPATKRVFDGEEADFGDCLPPQDDSNDSTTDGKENLPPIPAHLEESASAPPHKRKSWPGAERSLETAKRAKSFDRFSLSRKPDKAGEVVDTSTVSKFFGGGAPKSVNRVHRTMAQDVSPESEVEGCVEESISSSAPPKLQSLSQTTTIPYARKVLVDYGGAGTSVEQVHNSDSDSDESGENENAALDVDDPSQKPHSVTQQLQPRNKLYVPATSQQSETDEEGPSSNPAAALPLIAEPMISPKLERDQRPSSPLDAFRYSKSRSRPRSGVADSPARRLGMGPRPAASRGTENEGQEADVPSQPQHDVGTPGKLSVGVEQARKEVALGMQRKFGAAAMGTLNMEKFRACAVPYHFVTAKKHR